MVFRKFRPLFSRYTGQILELSKDNFCRSKLVLSDEHSSFYCREATYEKDYNDLVLAFPEELGLPSPEDKAKELTARFESGIPCFVVRNKETDALLGAVWAKPYLFNFLRAKTCYQGKKNFVITNLFVIPAQRGHGIAKVLLSFITLYLIHSCSCDYIHALVLEHRIPSLLSFLRIGYSISGTQRTLVFLGHYLTRFLPVNTNPYFKKYPKHPAVVLAQDGSNPIGIARALGRVGIPVYLLAIGKTKLICRCRYIEGIETVDSLDDTTVIHRGLKRLQQKIEQQHSLKPVLVVTNETHYYRLLPIKEYIDANYISLTPIEKTANLAAKDKQFSAAEHAGFYIPATMILRSVDDIANAASLTFPIIVKPNALHTKGNFREKVKVFDTFELIKNYLEPLLSGIKTELIVQEYVPGEDKQVLFFMASCAADGEPRVWVSGKKWRQYPPGNGVMASGILEPIPDFEQKCKELCRLFGLSGFIGIECKRHPITHRYAYIESSIRSEAFNSICEAAQMNLMLDAYLSALGQPCGIVQRQNYSGSWCSVSMDFDAARILISQKKMRWRDYFKPLPRPVVFSFFAWDDPIPFLCWLPKKCKSILCAIFRLRL